MLCVLGPFLFRRCEMFHRVNVRQVVYDFQSSMIMSKGLCEHYHVCPLADVGSHLSGVHTEEWSRWVVG